MFTDSSLTNNIHGLILLKLIIGTDGKFSETKVLKGISDSFDKTLLSFMKEKKSTKVFSTGLTHKNRITQEVVVPFRIDINGFSYYKNNYYYNPYFMHDQNMMWMQQNTINNIPRITY